MLREDYYYAIIDKIESAEEGQVYFEFHCLDKEVVDRYQSNDGAISNYIMESKDTIISFTRNLEDVKNYLQFTASDEDLESEWFLIAVNRNEEGLAADLFIENQEEQSIFIRFFERLNTNMSVRKFLDKKISLDNFPHANEESLLSCLNVNEKRIAEFVAVYNVGQGNCNAICDSQAVPLLYFDLGGGCYVNKNTYPTALRFCFSYKPTIVLSHWDADHIQSAKSNARALNLNWIVPYQKIGPVHFKFFLSIRGQKLIWPTALPELNFCWGKVILCTGPMNKKNHTGLAMDIRLNNTQYNTIRDVLLPADAAYTYISTVIRSQYDAIVATHHGAEFPDNNLPIPIHRHGKKAIAYSFGRNNSYYHPRHLAVDSHIFGGWMNRHDTENGNIALSDSFNILPLPCTNNCDLTIRQLP